MTDLHISDEAIAAQQAYDAAAAEVQRLLALLPSGTAIAAGEASISDEQRAEVQTARDDRLAALHVLRAARERLGDGNAVKAEMALRGAARAGDGSSGAA